MSSSYQNAFSDRSSIDRDEERGGEQTSTQELTDSTKKEATAAGEAVGGAERERRVEVMDSSVREAFARERENRNGCKILTKLYEPLSSSAPRSPDLVAHQVPILVQVCEEVEEGRRAWAQRRKEAARRLNRLEQQTETGKSEEVEAKLQWLREEEEEEGAWVNGMVADCRQKLRRGGIYI
ncbi:hypothetical protein GW17_00049104 [Ensete ventricosum]|nr:hypothetical protein GW17_00049104 [Ensete ventricosum]RZR91845.1 hypothetical protein BHM03_00020034 [Ensete ventricosum]